MSNKIPALQKRRAVVICWKAISYFLFGSDGLVAV